MRCPTTCQRQSIRQSAERNIDTFSELRFLKQSITHEDCIFKVMSYCLVSPCPGVIILQRPAIPSKLIAVCFVPSLRNLIIARN